jgi:putative membrane protein
MVAGVDPRGLVFGAIAIASAGPASVVLIGGLVIVAVARFLQWQRFRYGFDGAVVRVDQGVLQHRTRSIDVARIQQVEVDQPILHRVLGLAVLRLETASEGGETEVELNGVSLEEAEALRAALRPVAGATADDTAETGDAPPAPPRRTVLEVTNGQLALSAITGVQLLALPAALLVLSETVLDLGAEDDIGQTVVGLARGGGIAVLVVLVGVAAFVAAVVATLLRDGGYRVDVRGDDLVVQRGLLTTRQAVLPRHRVQVVAVRQNWVRRALGAATVHVRTAGGGSASTEARRIQVPLVRVGADLDALLDVLVPGRPRDGDLVPHPRAARRRAVVRTSLRFGLGAVPLALVAWALWVVDEIGVVPWGVPAAVAVVLLVLGPVLGLAEYRHLAHGVGDRVVASRSGAVALTTAYAPLERLQGVTQRDSPFQRRLGLATVSGHLAGAGATTSIEVLDVDRATAVRLRDHLTVAASRG